MTFIATYRDGKVILKEEIDEYILEEAYEQAKHIAKQNKWTLVKVEPKVYPPIPQIIHSERIPHKDIYQLYQDTRLRG